MKNRTYPIDQLLQYRHDFSQRAFAEEVAALVQTSDRINSRVKENGLLLEGVEEVDLESAVDSLYKKYGKGLRVGKPQIKYIFEGSILFEPYMSVVVTTPPDFFGAVVGDLSARRGLLMAIEDVGETKRARAEVPLTEMFGYSTALRSKTRGRGGYEMNFLEYRRAPRGPEGSGPGPAAARHSA